MRAPTANMPTHKPDVSSSYILMVQHLIERCLLMYMDREDCIRALAKYARVKPVITSTVWKELEKANCEFFSAYSKHRASRQVRVFKQALHDVTTKLSSHTLDSESTAWDSDTTTEVGNTLQPCQASLTS